MEHKGILMKNIRFPDSDAYSSLRLYLRLKSGGCKMAQVGKKVFIGQMWFFFNYYFILFFIFGTL